MDSNLLNSEQKYRALVETTKDGYWMIDTQANILEVNASYCKMSGYTQEELLKMKISAVEASESPEDTKKHIAKIIKSGSDIFETKHRKRNGEIYDLEVSISYSELYGGIFLCFFRDITDRKEHEKQLTLWAKVFSTMKDGVLITDEKQNIIEVNESFTQITGYLTEELLGKKPSMLSSGWHSKEFYDAMWTEINSNGFWNGEIVDRKKAGESYTAESSIVAIKSKDGTLQNYIAVSSDITYKKEQEKVINNLAYYDALTSLPNRMLFQERFQNRIKFSKRNGNKLAFMFIDLDNFKAINDTFGHFAGDLFLQDAAKLMKNTIREGDTIGRFGGDEFAIMIEGFKDASDLAKIATGIVDIFKQPFTFNTNQFYSGASVGISIYPDNANTYEELMMTADAAMYQIKHSGKNGYAFFVKELNDAISKKIKLENALKNAIVNDELYLNFQPIVLFTENKIVGAEALLRWKSEEFGIVSPDVFIPIAEQNGFVVELGEWVFENVCKSISHLKSILQDKELPYISINLSTVQIKESLYINFTNYIKIYNIEAKNIVLEITETYMLKNPQEVLEVITKFSNDGFQIAIDDFGTGYSSMVQLTKLPFDKLKIDKIFIDDLHTSKSNHTIVKTMINMGTAMNKIVIVEGVEEKAQLDILQDMGVKIIQGYYFYKPMLFDALIKELTL